MKTAATAGCRICRREDASFLSHLLEGGVSPRAIAKRVPRLSRKELERHRGRCLEARLQEEGVSGG